MYHLACVNCGATYPADEIIYTTVQNAVTFLRTVPHRSNCSLDSNVG